MRTCYLTLTRTTPTRDIVYLNGLRNLGVEIVECRDSSLGIRKFWQLWKRHRALADNYDVLLVGFAGHILVPFARLISKRKIVFNSLGSLYDGIIGSRKKYGFLGWRTIYCWLVDWLAFNSAHLTLLDTNARKKYVMHKYFIPENKLVRLWSGVDDTIFIYDEKTKKLPNFTVLFRGALMPEAGIEYLIQVADILKNDDVQFRIIGSGYMAPLLEKLINNFDLHNIEWIPERLSSDMLIGKMLECHVSIGQLSDHWRQGFHVPFKTIESMALKLPYVVTNNSRGILEFLKDGETCLCTAPANAHDLAKKILWLKNNPIEASRISQNAFLLFQREFTTKALTDKLINILASRLQIIF